MVDRASGAIRFSKKVTDRNLTIVDAGDDIVLAYTNAMVFAFDPKTGNKLWESATLTGAAHFKGVVITAPSARQLAALDAATGNVIFQNAGTPVTVWVDGDSPFVLEVNGVKEYALDRGADQGISNKEAMTELASVLVSKGDLDEAARFADRVAKESDPNYPPLRYVQAQIQQARGNAAAARRELVLYTDLVGRQSKAAQDVIAGLKRKDGLAWQTEIGAQAVQMSEIAEGKILGAGLSGLVALDQASGKVLRRQSVEHFMDMLHDDKSRRVFYAHGETANPKAIHLYVIGIDGNDRKEFARLTAAAEVTNVRLAHANGRLFVASFSVDRQSGRATLNIAAFNEASGTRLWEKTHDYTPSQMAQIRVAFGLFYPKGDFLVYSSGRDMWVLQAADGVVYAEDHENAPILPKRIHTDTGAVDPDITYFVAGTNQVAAFRLSSKQVVQRAAIPAQDPAFTSCAWRFDHCLRRRSGIGLRQPVEMALDPRPEPKVRRPASRRRLPRGGASG